MFKDVNKLSLTASLLMVIGVISLLLNVFGNIFNIIFCGLFIIALILLIIVRIKDYREYVKSITTDKQEMILDMAMNNQGAYEVIASSTKKYEKMYKRLKRDKFLPVLVLIIMALIMVYLGYTLIF